MRYKTKVDWWLGLLMSGSGLMMLSFMILIREPVAWVGGLMLAAIVLGLTWPCTYTLAEHSLQIQSGLVRWTVPYSEISRVNPTRNPIGSPAWSLDRLMIHYGSKVVMVSPVRRDEFLSELMSRAGLQQSGEELTR